MGEKAVLATEILEKSLQSSPLDVIATQRKHRIELAQLEQQITQLENDFAATRKLCS